MHDKTIAKATLYPLPPGSELLEDLGFLGLIWTVLIARDDTRNQKERV